MISKEDAFIVLTALVAVSFLLLLIALRLTARQLQSSVKTLTHFQAIALESRLKLQEVFPYCLPPSETSSKSTRMTWGTDRLPVEVLSPGQIKESYSGTRFPRVQLAFLDPTIGTSGEYSPKRSSRLWINVGTFVLYTSAVLPVVLYGLSIRHPELKLHILRLWASITGF